MYDKLLPTMNVTFVHNGQLTVLPLMILQSYNHKSYEAYETFGFIRLF